ncbi:MAG TPA: helix-turn-helix domain-containing protein [Candidatus Sulfomarinibacteraceae bacterium]|nr:helix-turn-helix domain-containing protein [Candidatus Sulfomarinibacteraceae bacterium]
MKDAMGRSRTWLTIQEASDLIGVSPATLRRWADAGDLAAFVTPGGHRRFTRSSILGLLPTAAKPRRRLQELGETPERVVRQYRRELAESTSPGDWVRQLGEADRESYREPGRQILTGVLGFLDAQTPEDGERSLAGALAGSAQYGSMARQRGMALDALTDTFLQFRLPFLHELGRIARRRRLHTDEAMDLLLAAARVFDRLLISLIRGHAGLESTAAADATSAPGLASPVGPASPRTIRPAGGPA